MRANRSISIQEGPSYQKNMVCKIPEGRGGRVSTTNILVECVDFADTRKRFYNVQDIHSLFKTVTKEKILGFIILVYITKFKEK